MVSVVGGRPNLGLRLLLRSPIQLVIRPSPKATQSKATLIRQERNQQLLDCDLGQREREEAASSHELSSVGRAATDRRLQRVCLQGGAAFTN